MKAQCIIKDRVGGLQSANVSICIGLDSKMLTNANKGTYLVKKCQKYANVIYERPLTSHKWLCLVCDKTMMKQLQSLENALKMFISLDYESLGLCSWTFLSRVKISSLESFAFITQQEDYLLHVQVIGYSQKIFFY